MKNLRLAPRIGLAFALVIALLLVVAGIGLAALKSVNAGLHSVTDDEYVKVRLVSHIREGIERQFRLAHSAVISENASVLAADLEAIAASRRSVGEEYDALVPRIVSDEGKRALADVQAHRVTYVASLDRLVALAKAGQLAEARTVLAGALRTEQRGYAKAMDELTGRPQV
jgi:methyl-accepting chemotaxis protein